MNITRKGEPGIFILKDVKIIGIKDIDNIIINYCNQLHYQEYQQKWFQWLYKDRINNELLDMKQCYNTLVAVGNLTRNNDFDISKLTFTEYATWWNNNQPKNNMILNIIDNV